MTTTEWTEDRISSTVALIAALKRSMASVIVGQHKAVDELIICLLAGGHALVEGVPGLGKTLLIKTLSQACHLQFQRVQFTPDLMPSDIIGTEILEEDQLTRQRVFRFQKGPVFTQLLLADEINRAPPKTQSALLEAMQERAISFAGETHTLPSPFFVLATQNPIEQAGTYPLPEAQLDRFLLEIVIDYPSESDEIKMLANTTTDHQHTPTQILSTEQLLKAQQLVREITISDTMLSYAARLVRATRPAESSVAAAKKHIAWGAGPRAGQALVLAAKARALTHNRLAVTREDVLALLPAVLRHRVIRNFEAEADGVAIESIIAAIAEQISTHG